MRDSMLASRARRQAAAPRASFLALASALLGAITSCSSSGARPAGPGPSATGGTAGPAGAGTGGDAPDLDAGEGGAGGQGGEGEPGGQGGEGGSSEVTSKPIPSPEALPIRRQSVDEDGSLILALSGLDPGGSAPRALEAHVITGPKHGSLLIHRGPVPLPTEYRPRRDYFGVDRFEFVIQGSDGRRSAPELVELVVRPVNDAPFAIDDTVATNSLTSVVIAVLENDFDADGDALFLDEVTQPESGKATRLTDGTVVFTPRHPDSGPVHFRYTMKDGAGATDTGFVVVNVTEARRPRIRTFTAAPPDIEPGESVTLSWEAENAVSCALDGGADTRGATAGSVLVTPEKSTLFRLTCAGGDVPATEICPVVVRRAGGADRDGDGLSDEVESVTGSDLFDADMDDDGILDGAEDANRNGRVDGEETDPRSPDSNGDGICDGVRTDNDGNGIEPPSSCLGAVLMDASNAAPSSG
jgi:hypothetical protein